MGSFSTKLNVPVRFWVEALSPGRNALWQAGGEPPRFRSARADQTI